MSSRKNLGLRQIQKIPVQFSTEYSKQMVGGLTLHGLRFGAFNGDFDLAFVCQQRPGGLVRRLLLIQLLLQHLQLVGQFNLPVALLLHREQSGQSKGHQSNYEAVQHKVSQRF